MGDFLSRLTERTLETAPIPRPVIAPAFASGAPTPSEGGSAPVPREGIIEELHPQGRPPQAATAPMPLLPDEPSTRGKAAAAHAIAPPAQAPMPQQPRPIAVTDDRRPEEPRRADRETGEIAPRPAPIEIRIVEREIERPREPRSGEERASDDDRRGFLLPAVNPTPPRELGDRSARSGVEAMGTEPENARRMGERESRSDEGDRTTTPRASHEERPRREAAPLPPLVAIEPQRPNRIEPLAASIPVEQGRRKEPDERSQPQTIQVTIGRIEVRATTAAPSAERRERRGAQVMSLDDYIRQRAGGGR